MGSVPAAMEPRWYSCSSKFRLRPACASRREERTGPRESSENEAGRFSARPLQWQEKCGILKLKVACKFCLDVERPRPELQLLGPIWFTAGFAAEPDLPRTEGSTGRLGRRALTLTPPRTRSPRMSGASSFL